MPGLGKLRVTRGATRVRRAVLAVDPHDVSPSARREKDAED
jgi:hypothetical protein